MAGSDSSLLRWWGGREVQGKVLDCVEQLLLPGKEDRMFNRQSVSRLLESCLVVEVWSEGTLVGIARVPTNKLARSFREWTRGIGGGSQGKGGGGGVGRRQHIGAALCRALGWDGDPVGGFGWEGKDEELCE